MAKALGSPCNPKQHMHWLYQGRGDDVWSIAAAYSDASCLDALE